MSTLLSIPFKKTYELPIRERVREYLLAHHADAHPNAFKWDIDRWESLRKAGTGGVVHIDRVQSALRYHAQLVFILTKLPLNIGLDIAYAPAFSPTSLPATLPNLIFERACVLFNLAALYSQLASAEDRNNIEGMKRTKAYYQAAAGTLKYMTSVVTPGLRASFTEEDVPLDLSDAFLRSLEHLMLAQAQEGVWQRAVLDNYKNGVIAKLAAKVASLYGAALNTLKEAPSSLIKGIPSGWLAHLETRQLHFTAAAQFRKSADDLDVNRYGHEIARLTCAQEAVRRGYDIARKGGVNPAVLSDIKSLLEAVQKAAARAEKDNDLIYHQEVPSASSLPPIVEVSLVEPVISSALTDPKSAVGKDAVIFGELLGYGAKVAIEIYKDRRRNWLQEEIIDRAQQLDDSAADHLRALNLPAALEALEKPVGLPPSLLKKAEQVRTEDGPARIESSIENVKKLAQMNNKLLTEAFDLLDVEVEEDEVFQEEASGYRLPSAEANKELVAKAERYRQILEDGAQSDEVVREKWEEWEQNITELTWSEADLEAAVPSSTVTSNRSRPSDRAQSLTLSHARQLRSLLESLDHLQRERTQAITRIKSRAEAEDITPRILKAAAAIERWVEVQPSMFDDVLDEEMAKYDKYKDDLDESDQQQEALLESIKERGGKFLQSRREDTSIKQRELALQSLDLAYHKYREITRNLDEGLKFYNDLGAMLTQFRETCKGWINDRRNEMRTLIHGLHSMSVREAEPPTVVSSTIAPTQPALSPAAEPMTQPRPRPTQQTSAPRIHVPPPGSHEWQAVVLPPPPKRSQG